MKKVIAIIISILLFVPSFVYAEGGKEMKNYLSSSSNTHYLDTPYKNYQNGSMTDLEKTSIGVTYTDSSGKRKSWNRKTGIVTDTALEDLYNAQLKAQTAALQSQRDSALSNLNAEKTMVTDNYYNKRNQAAAQSDVGALNFAQFMAGRGISGNAGALPEIYRNNALQGNIGALNQQEAADNAQIEANIANVNNTYESDLTSAKNQIEAAKLQATIDQMNTAKATALEQQRYDTQQAEKADTLSYNRLQNTKNDYANTVSQYSADYQAQINKVLNDGDPSNDWNVDYLAAARAKKIQDQKEQEAASVAAEAKAQQQQFENDYKLKQLDLDTLRTNYTVNRPYSSGGGSRLTANQQLNQTNNAKVSQMTNWIYSSPSTNDAIQRLVENKPLIIQQLIEAGYDGSSALNFYNNIYADLIE